MTVSIMSRETITFETIDITPTWAAIVPLLILVLQNPEALPSAHKEAQEEIMKLARAMDAANKNKKAVS